VKIWSSDTQTTVFIGSQGERFASNVIAPCMPVRGEDNASRAPTRSGRRCRVIGASASNTG